MDKVEIPQEVKDKVLEKKRSSKDITIDEKQLAQLIHQTFSKTLRHFLYLYAFKFGNQSEDYKNFRNESLKAFHRQFLFLFNKMETLNMIQRCECEGLLKDFPSSCTKCLGIGFVNKVK